MPVYQLQEEMPHSELVKWTQFFKSRPPEWRADNRTYMLLKAQGYQGKPQDVFPSLAAIVEEREALEGANAKIPTGKFMSMLKGASGGDVSVGDFFSGLQE